MRELLTSGHLVENDDQVKKVKQQEVILVIAMYILRERGYATPPKSQVLGFIRVKNLMNVPEAEHVERGPESIWENDIAWKRKNLLEAGYIVSPRHGHWKLTVKGDEFVSKMKNIWLGLESKSERATVLAELSYFTDELLAWKLRIAQGESLLP